MTGRFDPDPAKLILFCDKEQVGVLDIDFGNYLGKKSKLETAHMRRANYVPTGPSDLYFTADMSRFAEMSISFKAECMTREERR